MANLKKREIIILAIAAVFVLYAAYVYLIADRHKGKKVETGKESVKIETVLTGLTDEMNRNTLSEFDHYIIQRAQAGWGKNPFIPRDLYRAWMAKDSKGEGTGIKIIYSGYVDTVKDKLAVLNGIEYRIGEELKEEGYILKSITSSKVVIFDKRAGSNLDIPIQE